MNIDHDRFPHIVIVKKDTSSFRPTEAYRWLITTFGRYGMVWDWEYCFEPPDEVRVAFEDFLDAIEFKLRFG